MSLGSVDQLKDRKLKLLKNKRGDEIYKLLFYDWTTPTKVSIEVYPDLYKRGAIKKYRKSRPQSAVVRYFNAFNELGWLEVRPVKPNAERKEYRATLKPYYEYIAQKGIEVTEKEKKIIEREIEEERYPVIAYKEYFFDCITTFIQAMAYRYFEIELERFRGLEKMPLRKDSKINIGIDLALKFYDRISLKYLAKYLDYCSLWRGQHIKSSKKAYQIMKVITRVESELKRTSNYPPKGWYE